MATQSGCARAKRARSAALCRCVAGQRDQRRSAGREQSHVSLYLNVLRKDQTRMCVSVASSLKPGIGTQSSRDLFGGPLGEFWRPAFDANGIQVTKTVLASWPGIRRCWWTCIFYVLQQTYRKHTEHATETPAAFCIMSVAFGEVFWVPCDFAPRCYGP